MSAEMIRTLIEYHIDMTRRVWDSINQITEEQFITDDSYSRGSIRNLTVHITRTDQRWLMGLKNLPIPNGDFKFENYPTRGAPTFDQDFIMWLWSRNDLSRLWRT